MADFTQITVILCYKIVFLEDTQAKMVHRPRPFGSLHALAVSMVYIWVGYKEWGFDGDDKEVDTPHDSS